MADQFFGLTDTGKQRQNNEDTFIAQQASGNKFIIASVIDGVGGYSGGEVAASLSREAFLNRLNKPSGDVIAVLVDCFDLANEKIIQDKEQTKQHDSMACVATLALVDIANNQFYYAHVGDTRLYLLRDNSLVKISHDHSFVGFLEDSGRITEEAAMSHPKRNEINKALGFASQLGKATDYIETGQSPFLSGDVLLLCSDGLTDMVNKQDITNILIAEGSLKQKATRLIEAANAKGGRDNITVVLVQNNKASMPHEATMPSGGLKKKGEPITDGKPQPVLNHPVNVNEKPAAVKSSSILISILIGFMLVFLGTTVWQYLKIRNSTPRPVRQQAVSHPVKKERNKQEIKLQQAIDQLKGNVLVISDSSFKSPVLISCAIKIDRDSLFIKSKGKVVFQSDSGYHGAALAISPKCKMIYLDSLIFKNFSPAITVANNGLTLKDVKFINCTNAINNLLQTADNKYLSGKLPAADFKTDSLPAKTK